MVGVIFDKRCKYISTVYVEDTGMSAQNVATILKPIVPNLH